MDHVTGFTIALCLVSVSLTGCSATPPKADIEHGHLASCHESTKPWPIQPGHFYDKEIHFVPNAPEYKPVPKGGELSKFIAGYSVVSVQSGSVYEKLGLRNGDIVTSVNGILLDPAKITRQGSDNSGLQMLAKIREGATFTLQRCLKSYSEK